MTVIAEIRKNARETLRVEVGEFKGKPVVNCRGWIPKDDGTWIPTAKGLTLNPDLLPQTIAALTAAHDHAVGLGLVDG